MNPPVADPRHASQKLDQFKVDLEAATDRAELAEEKNKKLEQALLEREQEIQSLRHRLDLAESDNDKLTADLKSAKMASSEGEHTKSSAENLSRKVQLLEDELDKAEKSLKETTEKYVPSPCRGPD